MSSRKPPFLKTVRVKNFKAIRDSGTVTLTPLTVFIGNNGVGKSSLIEALETVQIMALEGLGAAMNRWKGIEHITNKHAKPTPDTTAPIGFSLSGWLSGGWGEFLAPESRPRNWTTAKIAIAASRNLSQLQILSESVSTPKDSQSRIRPSFNKSAEVLLFGRSDLIEPSLSRWQFLLMNPDAMGEPQPPSTFSQPQLAKNASNIASYLKSFYEADLEGYKDLVQAMRFIVPYADSIDHEQTGELIRSDYLTLTEGGFKIPGWLISTGTLRVLAILACLRHPWPPELLVIEELENGLDPRTLGLVMSEIQSAVEYGKTQVIITTHSPTLLDQVPLEYIVTVERENGQPVFKRPADDDRLEKWSEDFSPGRLYTMGRLTGGES